MRKQLIVTIEEELIPQWKAEAKSQGVSLSLLIERRMTVGHKKPKRFERGYFELKGKSHDFSVFSCHWKLFLL